MRIRWKRVAKISLFSLFSLFPLFLLFDRLSPVDLSAVHNTSRVVKAADDSWLYAQTNSEEKWRFPVDVTKLDRAYVQMLLMFEDRSCGLSKR